MKLSFHVDTRGIALALLLLGGCLSNPEPPAPTNKQSQPNILDIQALKKAFLDRQYDAKLVQQVNSLNQPDSH